MTAKFKRGARVKFERGTKVKLAQIIGNPTRRRRLETSRVALILPLTHSGHSLRVPETDHLVMH